MDKKVHFVGRKKSHGIDMTPQKEGVFEPHQEDQTGPAHVKLSKKDHTMVGCRQDSPVPDQVVWQCRRLYWL